MQKEKWQKLRSMLARTLVIVLLAIFGVVVSPNVAAAVDCQDGGYVIVFAGGANSTPGESQESKEFEKLRDTLSPSEFFALGESGTYDANPVDWGNSVLRGLADLSNLLVSRAHCVNETIILGGYSMGADVMGKAINMMLPSFKSRIGYVALYGDMFYLGNFGNGGNPSAACFYPPWVRIADPCETFPNKGLYGARWPYVPNDLLSRVGSWCDLGDGWCNGTGWASFGNHGTIYRERIPQSTQLIAEVARSKRNELNPSLPPSPDAISPPPAQPLPTFPAPGVPTLSTPSAISRNDRTMDVFYRSSDGRLAARGWDLDFGWNYQWWDADIVGNPVAVARKPEAMDMFWRGTNGSIWNMGWDVSIGWNAPVQIIGSGAVGDPVVISRAPGEMDLFWRSINNELKNVHWDYQVGWGSVVTRTGVGTVYSNPTVASRRSDLMDVFYKNASSQLVNLGWKAADGWYAPQVRCNNVAGNPVAVARKLTAMSVFYREPDGDLAECGWDANTNWGYQAWVVPMVGDPAVISRSESHMSIFYRKADGTVWERWWTGNWFLQGWNDGATGDLAVTSHSDTTTDVFFREGDSGLTNRGWDVSLGWHKTAL